MAHAHNVLVVIALVCFVLAFGVVTTIALVPVGLAFWVASELV